MCAQVLVGAYVIIDAVVAPLFGPVMRWLSRWALVRRIERWIGALPPYVVLFLLVVPFAVAEFAKLFALLLMGTGHLAIGIIVFVGAYVVSILVCERIFHAGKARLMTIGWFARLFNWAMAHKERLLAWCRTTEVWRRAGDLRRTCAAALRPLKARFGMMFGGKPGGP